MPTNTGESWTHDIFISYSSMNNGWVFEDLIPALTDAGFSVLTDREFSLGRPIIDNIEMSIKKSRYTILVMTPEWVESVWCELENIFVQTIDPAAREGRVLPIILKPCKVSDRLRFLTYLDLTHQANAGSGLSRLVAHISGAKATATKMAIVFDENKERYSALESQLAEQEWRRADETTRNLMVEIGTKSKDGLTFEEIQTFPCKELQLIDKLWTDHSRGRFGFSVQRKLLVQANYNEERFGELLGWRANGLWIAYADVRFDLSAPAGHLPIGGHTGLLHPFAALTLGDGVAGYFRNTLNIFKSGALDLVHAGGVDRFVKRLRAELHPRERQSGFALWWMAGRIPLLHRLGFCRQNH